MPGWIGTLILLSRSTKTQSFTDGGINPPHFYYTNAEISETWITYATPEARRAFYEDAARGRDDQHNHSAGPVAGPMPVSPAPSLTPSPPTQDVEAIPEAEPTCMSFILFSVL